MTDQTYTPMTEEETETAQRERKIAEIRSMFEMTYEEADDIVDEPVNDGLVLSDKTLNEINDEIARCMMDKEEYKEWRSG